MRSFLATLALVTLGCGSSPTGEPAPLAGEQASTSCPATLRATNGATCNRRGLECDIPITCDAVNEQATCVCDGTTFVCNDRIGVIPIGSDAICTPRSSPDDTACPPSMSIAAGMACDTVGKLCTYEGPICPESLTGLPALESCVCRGAAGGGKRYTCYPVKCIGD